MSRKWFAVLVVFALLFSCEAWAMESSFIVFEDFNGQTKNKSPKNIAGLSLVKPPSQYGEILIKEKQKGDNCLYINDKQPQKLNGAVFGFRKQRGEFNIRFDIMPQNSNCVIAIGENDVNLYPILTRNSLEVFDGSNRVVVNGVPISAGQWVNLTVNVRADKGEFDIYYEGEKLTNSPKFRTARREISAVKFMGGAPSGADDIRYT